jgi:hypothetical protein
MKPKQVYLAALLCASSAQVILMQHSPGGGKTWINILYGLYLHQ